MQSLLAKVKDLESRMLRKGRECCKGNPRHGAKSVKIDSCDPKSIKLDNEEACNDEFASQVIDAYFLVVNVVDSKLTSKAWYLDFGASNHVTSDSSIFSSFSLCSGTKIKSARGHSHDVTSVGNITICLPIGGVQQISHVFYSPSITKYLIVVGFLIDKGYKNVKASFWMSRYSRSYLAFFFIKLITQLTCLTDILPLYLLLSASQSCQAYVSALTSISALYM